MDKLTKEQFIKKHAYQIGIEKDVEALINSVKEEYIKIVKNFIDKPLIPHGGILVNKVIKNIVKAIERGTEQ